METDPSSLLYSIHIAAILIVQWDLIGSILLFVLLIFMSAMISGSEVAFFSINHNELNDLREDASPEVKRIISLREKPRTLLATILISNNFVNIAIVILSEYIVWNFVSHDLFNSWAANMSGWPILSGIQVGWIARGINFLLTTVIVTFLLVLFGEVLPKIYAKINNLKLAKFMSIPLTVLSWVFGPFSRILVRLGNRIEQKLEGQNANLAQATKDDIDKAIELTVKNQKYDRREAEILKRIVKFSDVTVKQIMRSRVDVVSLSSDVSFEEVLQTVKDSGYSRIPVYEDDMDTITGILYAKDLLVHLNENKDFHWQELIRTQVLFVPESKKINELLKEFQEKRTHMAIVVDEYGGSEGIVTLEDVMEEVVGEIRDEFDTDEQRPWVKINARTYLLEGKTLLNDVIREMGERGEVLDRYRGEADSVAGLILENHGFIPAKNQEIEIEGIKFIVVNVSKRRIEKVKMILPYDPSVVV